MNCNVIIIHLLVISEVTDAHKCVMLMFLVIIFQPTTSLIVSDRHDNMRKGWTVWFLGIIKHAWDVQNAFCVVHYTYFTVKMNRNQTSLS